MTCVTGAGTPPGAAAAQTQGDAHQIKASAARATPFKLQALELIALLN
jgi:hypothetical protein